DHDGDERRACADVCRHLIRTARPRRTGERDKRRHHPRQRPENWCDREAHTSSGAGLAAGASTGAPRETMVAAASCPVTLAAVRNMSGIVSTPRRIPIPSTGNPALARTGAMAMIEPPGIPGML